MERRRAWLSGLVPPIFLFLYVHVHSQESGITEPISGGEVRDKQDQYKGMGIEKVNGSLKRINVEI